MQISDAHHVSTLEALSLLQVSCQYQTNLPPLLEKHPFHLWYGWSTLCFHIPLCSTPLLQCYTTCLPPMHLELIQSVP